MWVYFWPSVGASGWCKCSLVKVVTKKAICIRAAERHDSLCLGGRRGNTLSDSGLRLWMVVCTMLGHRPSNPKFVTFGARPNRGSHRNTTDEKTICCKLQAVMVLNLAIEGDRAFARATGGVVEAKFFLNRRAWLKLTHRFVETDYYCINNRWVEVE